MLKISAVSYLNTVPFIHGLKQSELIHSISLQLDYPSICADKLINGIVDLALVPVAVIPKLLQAHIISDYCIGANGAVDTVCLYSDVPITEIESIALDYQSRTSVALLKILLKEYWQLNPELKKADVGFEENIKGKHAALVIGDRAFALNDKHAYIYDLSAIWKEMTGLPFVFAAWVANKKLPQDFIIAFNKALEKGLSDIDTALVLEGANYPNCTNPEDYLNNKISYNLDAEKQKGMELFLKKVSAL
ncbi:MAG: menaquinone biosynthesis protein [Flavobacteriales bacterium]|jgi:chorismate dehydratase|nr:menaquinone biosynthesis protein [Flavobacteriales bacterium]|tara:strand:+ start:7325 stop:8068 length:744 start_codon:yes stop_codon:yes gene_type:complete